MRVFLSVGFCIAYFVFSDPAWACGPTSPCWIGSRFYQIALPKGFDGSKRIGAIVYLHGWRAHPSGVMQHQGLRQMATVLGVALVAPKSLGENWALINAPNPHKNADKIELTFFDELLDALPLRHPINAHKLVVAGFSAGAMMVWTLACERSSLFVAYIPMAGTFWDPVPQNCPTLTPNLFHLHGIKDRMVPLTGRQIGMARQGDVTRAFALFQREANLPRQAESFTESGRRCLRWQSKKPFRTFPILERCLHQGGHRSDPLWIKRVWHKLEQLDLL